MKAFVAVSSLLGLTAADPWVFAPYRALGGAGIHPTGVSYSNRSPQGLGKRDADADAFGLGAGGFIRQARPGLAAFGIAHNGYGAFAHGVGKRDADADAFYAPVLAKGYPSWPGVVAPGFESTCYGCGLGKRSADADPLGYYGYAPFRALGGAGLHPTGASYSNRSPQGLGKREADADAYYGYAPFRALGGAGLHPTGASYSNRSPQGLGKREAEEEPKKALAAHPKGGNSFVGQTVWGFPLEKREAGEEPVAEDPREGVVYIGQTVWGFPAAKAVEKRDAEPAVSFSNRSPQGAYGAYAYAPAPYYWG